MPRASLVAALIAVGAAFLPDGPAAAIAPSAHRAATPARGRRPPAARGSMLVGLDVGGWAWRSAVRDEARVVRYVRSSYRNWESDSQMAIAARYGMHILPLFNEWSVSSLVPWFRRYGHGGSFWAGRRDLGATTAELVNEPGNPFFWGGGATGDEAQYAALVEEAARVLQALAPANRPRLLVSFDGGFTGDSYGRDLIRVDPHLLRLGLGWTVHPYGGHAAPVASAAGNRARVIEAHAATHQPVYVTEVGWPTCGATGDSLSWSPGLQAQNLSNWMSWARGLGYVALSVYFSYADYGSNCYGIVNSSGLAHKPAYTALAQAAQG